MGTNMKSVIPSLNSRSLLWPSYQNKCLSDADADINKGLDDDNSDGKDDSQQLLRVTV